MLRAAASAQTFPIALDNTISDGVPGVGAGRMNVNSEVDFYTFNGTAGQGIFVEEVSVSAAFAGWLRWELKAPSGASVFSTYLEGSNEGRRTLPETGTYTVRVWVGAANPAYIGTYAFRLRSVPADPTFAVQLSNLISNAIPAAGAGNVEVPGACDYYTFAATNGQIVFFETLAAAASFQGYLNCEVRGPASNLVFSSYMTAGNNPGRKVLTENGTYRVKVYAQSYSTNHVGTYAMRIRAVAADQNFVIQPGSSVSNNIPAVGAGNIEMPGAQDYYTFTGVAGQGISFQGLSKSPEFAGWLQWEAKSPTGQSVFSAYFGDIGRKILPETGTYTIRVWAGANNTSYLGNYAFRLFTLAGDVNCAIQKGDTISDGLPMSGAGRIDEPGGLDTYTFAGIAGQRVNFDQLTVAPAFAGYLYWQVVAPTGTNWFVGYFPGGTSQRRTLPETGLYTIRVFANSPNSTHVGPYSFRTWCEVKAGPDQFAALPNTALTMRIQKFLCNDTLEIGDVLVVEPANATTARGGTITVVSNALIYTPPAGFSGYDNFTYRLRGQFGDEDTANVSLRVGTNVNQGANVVSLVRQTSNSVMCCLLGAPLQNYIVEQSTNLTTWTSNSMITADAGGSITYYYSIEAVPQRYYRFRKP